jgi:hypothetical protein
MPVGDRYKADRAPCVFAIVVAVDNAVGYDDWGGAGLPDGHADPRILLPNPAPGRGAPVEFSAELMRFQRKVLRLLGMSDAYNC